MRISGAGDKEPRCACIFSKFSAFDYGVCAVGKRARRHYHRLWIPIGKVLEKKSVEENVIAYCAVYCAVYFAVYCARYF
jgi:hypothetical protein